MTSLTYFENSTTVSLHIPKSCRHVLWGNFVKEIKLDWWCWFVGCFGKLRRRFLEYEIELWCRARRGDLLAGCCCGLAASSSSWLKIPRKKLQFFFFQGVFQLELEAHIWVQRTPFPWRLDFFWYFFHKLQAIIEAGQYWASQPSPQSLLFLSCFCDL